MTFQEQGEAFADLMERVKLNFPSIFEEFKVKMSETLQSKGHDYSNEDRLSNFKEVASMTSHDPREVCLNLIATKVSRISNLFKNVKPNNESLQDSLLDLQCYSMLLHMIEIELEVTRQKDFIFCTAAFDGESLADFSIKASSYEEAITILKSLSSEEIAKRLEESRIQKRPVENLDFYYDNQGRNGTANGNHSKDSEPFQMKTFVFDVYRKARGSNTSKIQVNAETYQGAVDIVANLTSEEIESITEESAWQADVSSYGGFTVYDDRSKFIVRIKDSNNEQ